jgi:hypothetical protein
MEIAPIMDNKISTISDSRKPNPGRIDDDLPGGHHYFEIDEQAAEQFITSASFAPKPAKLIRWFPGIGIGKAVRRGFTQFIDFASGLPTVDHIHYQSEYSHHQGEYYRV